MRDIRFRAWDEGKMVQWPEWAITFHGQLLKEYAPDFTYVTGSAIPPIMQYTGLKDKNGVEIYEGDIIVYLYFAEDRKAWRVGRTVEVKWRHTPFRSGWNIGAGFGDKVRVEGYEVIGNIYETPELLTTNTPQGKER